MLLYINNNANNKDMKFSNYKNNYKILKIKKKFCYENISKGTKFQDYCIDSIGKRLIK